nr:MAG TPA: BRO family protein [Caudoviricetes sp.]
MRRLPAFLRQQQVRKRVSIMNNTFIYAILDAGGINICGKTIHYVSDEWDTHGWNFEDVISVLDLTDTHTVVSNVRWPEEAQISEEFGILLSCPAVTRLCLVSRNLEARAHLYRRTHGVEVSPDGPWGHPYNAKDMAVCLGYDNPSRTIREYFRHAPSELTVSQVYRLATGSTLPDAEEFVEDLFDSTIAEYIEAYKKYGLRKHCNIPFVYKDSIIRTFVEDNGGLLFCLTDVTWALGIVDYEEEDALVAFLGRDAKKERKVGWDMHYGDTWDTVITEAGLDKLIERANSPEGESLKQWVADKVKPALQ